MFRTLTRLSKVITIPKLSPTHSKSRIVKWLAEEGQQVRAYDLILEVECASDMVTEAYREHTDERKIMVIDTQEEGILRNLMTPSNEFLNVGTEIGIIDEDDDLDIEGPWIWQAYLKDEEQ